jgi:hypothetical protein
MQVRRKSGGGGGRPCAQPESQKSAVRKQEQTAGLESEASNCMHQASLLVGLSIAPPRPHLKRVVWLYFLFYTPCSFFGKKKCFLVSKTLLDIHRPGIEPGSLPWQGSILPLDQRCATAVMPAQFDVPPRTRIVLIPCARTRSFNSPPASVSSHTAGGPVESEEGSKVWLSATDHTSAERRTSTQSGPALAPIHPRGRAPGPSLSDPGSGALNVRSTLSPLVANSHAALRSGPGGSCFIGQGCEVAPAWSWRGRSTANHSPTGTTTTAILYDPSSPVRGPLAGAAPVCRALAPARTSAHGQ